MLESLARGIIWPLLIGAILGGAAALFGGPALFWGAVSLALAAAFIIQFITFQEPVLRPAEPGSDDPLGLLSPQTRLLLEQLPMPVMLLDGAQCVLFANKSMRDVLGTGLDGKRVSAVLRNPEVLLAITDAGHGCRCRWNAISRPMPRASASHRRLRCCCCTISP